MKAEACGPKRELIAVLERGRGMWQERGVVHGCAVDRVEVFEDKLGPLPSQARMLPPYVTIGQPDTIELAASERFVIFEVIELTCTTAGKDFEPCHWGGLSGCWWLLW